MGDPGRVPYERLARAEHDARAQYPHATRVKGLWTPALRELLSELEDVRVWRENNDLPAKWTA